jgi:hypothetical protein
MRFGLERGQVVENLGKRSDTLRDLSLEAFDKDAHRYHPEVYQRKREEFDAKMTTDLKVCYMSQLRNLHRRAISQFKQDLVKKIREGKGDFATKLKESELQAASYFEEGARSSRVTGTDWTWEEEAKELHDELLELGTKVRQEEMDKHVQQLEKTIRTQINEQLLPLMNKADVDIWPKVWQTFTRTLAESEEALIGKARALDADTEETLAAEAKMKRDAWEVFRTKIAEETSDSLLMTRLRTKYVLV